MIKDQVEADAGVKLECKDDIVQWFVEWGAMFPLRFLVGTAGKTASEGKMGRPCNIPAEQTLERILYKGLRPTTELIANLAT